MAWWNKAPRLWLGVLLISVVLGGCKGEATSLNRRKAPKGSKFLRFAREADLSYETLKFRGKAKYDAPEESQNFRYRIHLRKDSVMWVSLSTLGFEGIRALIRPDSAFILNRMDNTVMATDLGILSELVGFRVDFQDLQNLLIGQAALAQGSRPLSPAESRADSARKAESVLFRRKERGVVQEFFFAPESGKLTALLAHQQQQARNSWIVYRDYQMLTTTKVPYLAKVDIEAPQQSGPTQIELKHKDIDVNPERIHYKFEIPGDYAPVQP